MWHLDTSDQMRVLIVSLRTYSAPYNDGKLDCLGPRLEHLAVITGDLPTLWGSDNPPRRGPGYDVIVLPSRFARSNATARLIGLEKIAFTVNPTLIHVECEPWQQVAVQSVRLAKRLGTPIGIQFAERGPLLRGVGGAIRRAAARGCSSVATTPSGGRQQVRKSLNALLPEFGLIRSQPLASPSMRYLPGHARSGSAQIARVFPNWLLLDALRRERDRRLPADL